MEEPATAEEEEFEIEVIDAQAFEPSRFVRNVPFGYYTFGFKKAVDGEVEADSYREGVLADGTSLLVIRLKPVNWAGGPVTFELSHSEALAFPSSPIVPGPPTLVPQTAVYNGSLSPDVPVLPAINLDNGRSSATVESGSKLVYYRPPNNYRFGPTSLSQVLTITAKSSGQTLKTTTINLIRPPIILAHGINSSASALGALGEYLTSDGRNAGVVYLDYSDENTSGFDATSVAVADKIDEILRASRDFGFAATRVDYFAHSMGGVILKWYASNLGDVRLDRGGGFPPLVWPGGLLRYIRNDNFRRGDIRRLVTVGSPFQGSVTADVVSNVGYVQLRWLIRRLSGAGFHGNGCAYWDLSVRGQNNTMARLTSQHFAISWCPIVGIGAPGKTARDLAGSPWGLLLALRGLDLDSLGSLLLLYPQNSDLIVWAMSQIDQPGVRWSRPRDPKYQVVRNVTHQDELQAANVFWIVARVLDLDYYFSPREGGFVYFNEWF